MSKVTNSQLKAFRDYIDGHNKHNIRLEEKDVPVKGTNKYYKYFAMQVNVHISLNIKYAKAYFFTFRQQEAATFQL